MLGHIGPRQRDHPDGAIVHYKSQYYGYYVAPFYNWQRATGVVDSTEDDESIINHHTNPYPSAGLGDFNPVNSVELRGQDAVAEGDPDMEFDNSSFRLLFESTYCLRLKKGDENYRLQPKYVYQFPKEDHPRLAAYRRDIIIEHDLRSQIENLNKYFSEHTRECAILADNIHRYLNDKIMPILPFNKRFTKRDDSMVEVTDALILQATDHENHRRLDKNQCISFYQQTAPGETEFIYGSPEHKVDAKTFVADRTIEFTISEALDRVFLDTLDFKNNHYLLRFRQLDGKFFFRARIVSWNKHKFTYTNESSEHTSIDSFVLSAVWDPDPDGNWSLDNFIDKFPTTIIDHDAKDGQRIPVHSIIWFVQQSNEDVVGMISEQGLQLTKMTAGVPIRLGMGDVIRSNIPNVDSMSYYSNLALVSSDGFLFQEEKTDGFSAPILLSLPIDNPYSLGATDDFEVKSVSSTPRGDVMYNAHGNQPQMHNMITNLPLRSGSIRLELQPRLSSQPVQATLKPKGVFEVKLFFCKKTIQ